MSVAIVTGASGLVGSNAVRMLAGRGLTVAGIDNDFRARFFGPEATTMWNRRQLEREVPRYEHHALDIRDADAVGGVFRRFGSDISLVVHAAGQPSHDWAARDPVTDFTINANGTLVLLESTRVHAPDAVFVFTSTNKVYGDSPNRLPLVEQDTRWALDPAHPFAVHGIDETLSIDRSLHSVFGASKVAADVLVQEYGRYFGLRSACFRCGCVTGPEHAGAELHGFLAYLVRCTLTGRPYTVFGYQGKQVRDNIHADDLVGAMWRFFEAPRVGEVYNIGGGPDANCSMLEAIGMVQDIAGRALDWTYSDGARAGDHIWWVSDLRRFMNHYPGWQIQFDLERTVRGIVDAQRARSPE